MDRRGFFSRIAALAVAPAAVRLVPLAPTFVQSPWVTIPVGSESFKYIHGMRLMHTGPGRYAATFERGPAMVVTSVDHRRGTVTVSAVRR